MKSVSLLVLVVLVCFVSFSSGTRYTVSFQGLVGRLCGSGSPSGCPDSSQPFISASPSVFPTGFPNPTASTGASTNPTSSTGVSSSTGATFSTNPTSSTGATFSTNPTGSTGASRSTGATFSTNPTSSTGVSGSTGATFSTNPTSSTGVSGSTGATFSTNPTGSTGATFSTNPTGSTGASSSTGASGSSFGPSSTSGVTASTGASINPSGVSSSSNANSGSISTSACPVCPVCPSQSNFPTFSRAATSTTISVTATRAPSGTVSPSPNPCGPQYEAATTNSFGVGLLFDRTTWARDNGNPAVFGALYAINQINAAGGIVIGGKNVSLNPIIYDTQGLPNNTVEGARSLIGSSCVSVLIGTDDSSQRRAVQQSILDSTAPSNAAPGLLLNPQPYPADDVNLGVINFGANLLTNTRHAIDWAFTNNKTHIHLLGSDDVDSRLINSYARQYITNTYPGILIIGEDYIPVGASEFTAQQTFLAPLFIGARLFDNAAGNRCPNNTACTMALSTVYGQAANRILFSALAARYLTPNNPNVPYVVMSLRNGYYEALNFTFTNQNNQLIGSNYLDQVDAVSNSNIASFKTGVTSFIRAANLVNDTRLLNLTTGLELNAYNAIRLWANAVAAAGTANPSVIRTAITNATFNSPAGQISVNATSRQASTAATTPFYISRITSPPLLGLVNTVVATYNDAFVQYAPPVGNLTSPQSYATVVSGIRNYYLGNQNATYQSVSLGWETPAIPSPTS